jgi:NAD(P)-dependent dehydrogenase (short-subunit alcohol dehydrogenase family)
MEPLFTGTLALAMRHGRPSAEGDVDPTLFDLAGHVALVTGGNSGVGLGMAHGLARAGAAVCIWGTNEEKNEQATAQLATYGTTVAAMRVDIADEGAVTDAMTRLVDKFGRLDSCFANAALTVKRDQPHFVETPLEHWQHFMRVNLDGTFLTLRAAAKQLIAQGEGGSLVGTSSIAARLTAPRDSAYATSKAGICALMRSLAGELGRYGIRANTVLPGWTRSPSLVPYEASETVADAILRRMPLHRWGEQDDWAGIAVYLASAASRFHTADEFRIDGGFGAA